MVKYNLKFTLRKGTSNSMILEYNNLCFSSESIHETPVNG